MSDSGTEVPFFSIVTIVYNDTWSLSKTLTSVASQTFTDYEYLVIDGASNDGVENLREFWRDSNLIDRFVSEPDTGVYDAMNKGVRLARGKFVCFMNAGDKFNSPDDLSYVHDRLRQSDADALIGWGRLKKQIWTSWYFEKDSVRMSSLGFCHQALYQRRDYLLQFPFDDRLGKTDSDTQQLANSIAAGAKVLPVQQVLAIRSPSDGLSADLKKTARSISQTLSEDYAEINATVAGRILAFRRNCEGESDIIRYLQTFAARAARDLAIMVLDTLFLKQARGLSPDVAEQLLEAAIRRLDTNGENTAAILWRLQSMIEMKTETLRHDRQAKRMRDEQKVEWLDEIAQASPASQCVGEFVVSFTTFPDRVDGLALVLESLVNQTVRPREIHLNIGRDEFRNEWALPADLLAFREDGLVLNFVDRTRHQYDKFLHNHAVNDDQAFVIVDDDVIYEPRAMEYLIEEHARFPDAVIGNRCHEMTFTGCDPLPYNQWHKEAYFESPNHRAFATGAGGVLYPPGFFARTVGAMNTVLTLCPYADDVWLKLMSIKNNYPVKTTAAIRDKVWKLGYTPDMSEAALHSFNVDLGLNDLQVAKSWKWLSSQGVDLQNIADQGTVANG